MTNRHKAIAFIIILASLMSVGAAIFMQSKKADVKGVRYTVKVIDGCEYLEYKGQITHKGNCANH